MDKGGETVRAYRQAAEQLPQQWAAYFLRLRTEEMDTVTELRLRSDCPLAVTQNGKSRFVMRDGTLADAASPALVQLTHRELQECFLHLCRYSVFAYENQLRRGFFTLRGGHRVGVAAPAVWDGDRLCQPKAVTSLVIRIARDVPLQQPERWSALLKQPTPQLLIAGAPGSGKTTVLRGLAALLSQRGLRVAVADERCELFPPDIDGFGFARPWNCDVLSGLPKSVALEQALRSLSPQVLLCDELGSGEAEGLLQSLNSGVGFIATVHAAHRMELLARPQVQTLLAASVVRSVVFLSGTQPGEAEDVWHVAP